MIQHQKICHSILHSKHNFLSHTCTSFSCCLLCGSIISPKPCTKLNLWWCTVHTAYWSIRGITQKRSGHPQGEAAMADAQYVGLPQIELRFGFNSNTQPSKLFSCSSFKSRRMKWCACTWTNSMFVKMQINTFELEALVYKLSPLLKVIDWQKMSATQLPICSRLHL